MKYLVSVLILLSFFVYIHSPAYAASIGLSIETKSNVMILSATADSETAIRGYDMKFSFDPKVLQVRDISYDFGVVSQGLGDDVSSLKQVNQEGMIIISGESNKKDGERLTKSSVPVITIEYTGDASSLRIVKGSAVFYAIGENGILSKIPVEEGSLPVSNKNINSDSNQKKKVEFISCDSFWSYVLGAAVNPFAFMTRAFTWVNTCNK